MINELNHFGIVIKNLDKSMAFYRDVLGGQVVYEGFIPGNNTDVVYFLIGGGLIELLHRADAGPDEAFGINHIAFLSDDLDGDYDRLVAAGYEGLVAPKTAGTGVGRLSFLSDPNGARVEVLQRDVKMRENPKDHVVIKSFAHFAVGAPDFKNAQEFYGTQLGMTPDSSAPVLQGEAILSYDFDVLKLLETAAGDDLFQHFALRVDNISGAVASFAAQGVAATDVTENSALIHDPDGVKIKLVV